MRKYIIGILIGFALSFAVSAHAAVENLIGRMVEGVFPVKVNGVQIDKQALVVDGTSYLPVRAIGDALNMDVSFDADLGIGLSLKQVGGTVAATELKNTIKPHRFEKANTKIEESVVSTGGEFGLIEIDGNQYVSLATFGRPFTIVWKQPNAIFSNPGHSDIAITISDSYSSNIDGFRVDGTSYVKLSLLGLKATVNADTLIIDKQ